MGFAEVRTNVVLAWLNEGKLSRSLLADGLSETVE